MAIEQPEEGVERRRQAGGPPLPGPGGSHLVKCWRSLSLATPPGPPSVSKGKRCLASTAWPPFLDVDLGRGEGMEDS